MEFSVVDVETTGFSRRIDRIVEIAIIRINESGEIIREYNTLVNPKRDVGPSHIHGITASDVINAPTFEEVKNSVLEVLNDSVIVSHNKSFDLGFLQSEFSKSGVDIPQINGICTLNLSKLLFPELPSRKLEVLCEYLDILIENAHRAYDDCLATMQLFSKMYQTYKEEFSTEKFTDQFVKNNYFQSEIKSGEFIEYKRESAKEEIKSHHSKMRAFLNRIPDFYKPVEYNISEYLNLLDKILEDRLITDKEIDELENYTTENKISSDQIQDIHHEYFRRLTRYYLADNILSEVELIDLEKVAMLLQIEEGIKDKIIKLEKAELKFGEIDTEIGQQNLQGKSVCFTGQLMSRLNGELISKDLAHSVAIEKGLIVKKGVSKKLDILVVADPNSQSGKARKAREIGINIIAESVFWRKLGITIE